MKEILAQALTASIGNPTDPYEVDLLVDAASVGVTEKALSSTDRKMEWTEDVLSSTFGTLKGMPINLKLNIDEETGEVTFDNHTTTVVGRVEEATYDASRKVGVAKGKLWKHYFPETIATLQRLFDEGKVQASTEFMPTKMEAAADGIDRPLAGRFIGLGLVDEGADGKNFIHLMASAKKEEAAMKLEESRKHGAPLVGTYEWIGENLVQHLNSSATSGTNKEFIATYPDNAVWYENGKYYKTPYTISVGTNTNDIKFGDTIEVEQEFKPLSASAPESVETPAIEPTKEAREPMAEITDAELQALKASAASTDELKTELETLKASVAAKDTELAEAKTKLDEATAREEEQKALKLASSRMEELEKILPYDDKEQKEADLEVLKTVDEKGFELLKRGLTAAAANRGGVAPTDDPIRNPFESRQDGDGAASAILNSDEYKALKLSVSAKKEDK